MTNKFIIVYQQQPQTKPEKKTVSRKVVVQLTKFEKVLYITLITVIAMLSIYMLSLKMDAYDTRGKIADLDYKIDKQSSENSAYPKSKRILLMNAYTKRLRNRG